MVQFRYVARVQNAIQSGRTMESLIKNNYESASYSELSQEFKQLYPTAVRAFQLIPRMYNRLTLVDKYSHKEAILKILEDHKELPGFSRRNIYRALPSDNPNIPRRVVSPRHKPSYTKYDTNDSLSTNNKGKHNKNDEYGENGCPDCNVLKIRNQQLEEALERSSGPTLATCFKPQIHKFTVPIERFSELVQSIEKSSRLIQLEFDNNGNLISIVPDSHLSKSSQSSENLVA